MQDSSKCVNSCIIIECWLSSRNSFFGGGGKIYCYTNLYCCANSSILFGPNFGGVSEGAGGAPCPLQSNVSHLLHPEHLVKNIVPKLHSI